MLRAQCGNSSPGCNTAAAARPRALARLIGVDVRFGPRRVLRDITLEVAPGDFWTLIGPNGAGKSTVMGMISRLIAHDSGLVDFEGKDIGKWKSKELSKRLPS